MTQVDISGGQSHLNACEMKVHLAASGINQVIKVQNK